VKSANISLTSGPTQTELVVLAVHALGGDQRAVDTEDVAFKVNELAPGRFSWRKYPDQINLELVRVYLSAAKDSDHGALLTGSGQTGWTLTASGLKWAKGAGARLLTQDTSRARQERLAGSIDETRWRRERARVTSTAAWAHWRTGQKDISRRDAAEVFRIDHYAVGRIRDLKVARLDEMFKDDPEVRPFLGAMAGIVQSEEGHDESGK